MTESNKKIYVIAHRETLPNHEQEFYGVKREPKPADYYKIGIATDPEKQLGQLNMGTPHKLELVTTIRCENAECVERKLHNIYRPLHQTGEWFYLLHWNVESLEKIDVIDSQDLEGVNNINDWVDDDGLNLYAEITGVEE